MKVGRIVSARRGFLLHLGGTTAYSLAQWLLLVLLAHLASSSIVGRFALMLAVTAPIFLMLGMNLRIAQATDVGNLFSRSDYRNLRHILNAIASVLSVAVGILTVGGEVGVALVGLCIAKSSEGLSDTDYGFFQRLERLDLVSRSLFARSLLGPLGFGVGYQLTDDLAGATWGLAGGWMVVQLVLDGPGGRRLYTHVFREGSRDSRSRTQRLQSLARRCAPLGVAAGVSSLGVNTPRYAVQGFLGSASLGVFASLAYLAQTISMVTSSMSAVFLPRLALAYRDRRRGTFWNILGRLVFFGLSITTVGTIVAYFVGEPILRPLLGEEYARRELLTALMVSAGATTLQRMTCKGLEAAHRFGARLVVDLLTTGTIAAAAILMVPKCGLEGAAHALTIGFLFGAAVAMIALIETAQRMNGGAVH